MKRWIIVTLALALLLLGAAPAWAHLPPGQGLMSFGPVSCEGLGTVEVFGPRGQGAATGFAATGEHVVAKSLSGTFTDLEGNVFSFTKNYGVKAGLETFNCTQQITLPGEGSGDLAIVVAIVPPR